MTTKNGANAAPANRSTFDVEQFRTSLSQATAEQKQLALYWLLRDLCGPRMEQEHEVYDRDEFLYACVISPGQREVFRLLENPARAEELRQAALEPMTPISEIHRELGLADD